MKPKYPQYTKEAMRTRAVAILKKNTKNLKMSSRLNLIMIRTNLVMNVPRLKMYLINKKKRLRVI